MLTLFTCSTTNNSTIILHAKKPISIDLHPFAMNFERCLCILYIYLAYFLNLCLWVCVCVCVFWPTNRFFSIILIICHTISFNTILRFHRKFPIILLRFISLEFSFFLSPFANLSYDGKENEEKNDLREKIFRCIPVTLSFSYSTSYIRLALENGCHY